MFMEIVHFVNNFIEYDFRFHGIRNWGLAEIVSLVEITDLYDLHRISWHFIQFAYHVVEFAWNFIKFAPLIGIGDWYNLCCSSRLEIGTSCIKCGGIQSFHS
mmetsp:Transcript_61897/g.107708  ORF Transcript_61897/g.107708 Transcript_61897/m.107708 type:complete len:102 (+) Transcript_61897:149-454(+)